MRHGHRNGSTLARAEHVTRSMPGAARGRGPLVQLRVLPAQGRRRRAALWQAIRRLERLRPSFVSVTYGAGGSTRDRTVRVTARIARDTTLTPVAHLTCVGTSVAELRQVVGEYADAGVRNVLALRGDPPGGPGARGRRTPRGSTTPTSWSRWCASLGTFAVGVAAFPDAHPESASLDHDADVLVAKADAGAEFAITQFFFDADGYFRLRDRVWRAGATCRSSPASCR